jgi:enoyl-[acyl-carrier protein] reductase I
VIITYQGESLARRVKPLADSIGARLVEADVTDDAAMDTAFARIAELTGASSTRWSTPSPSPTRTS